MNVAPLALAFFHSLLIVSSSFYEHTLSRHLRCFACASLYFPQCASPVESLVSSPVMAYQVCPETISSNHTSDPPERTRPPVPKPFDVEPVGLNPSSPYNIHIPD